MRPFRFFFVLSLGIFFFFFIARFVILALIVAAIMSVVFHLARKVKRFFQRLDWQDYDTYDYRLEKGYETRPQVTYIGGYEPQFGYSKQYESTFYPRYKVIEID